MSGSVQFWNKLTSAPVVNAIEELMRAMKLQDMCFIFNVHFLCFHKLCSLLQIRFSSVQKVCIWQRNGQSSTRERLRLVLTVVGWYASGSTDSSYITSLIMQQKTKHNIFVCTFHCFFSQLSITFYFSVLHTFMNALKGTSNFKPVHFGQ
jgi:hypothetical protein